jgi:hypothetical protein
MPCALGYCGAHMNKTIILAMVLGLGGLAAAGDGKDAKAPAPTKAMEMKGPPKEVADMAKAMTGTWNCTGKGMMDGTAIDMTGKFTSRADLDGFWVHDSLDGKMGKMPFKFESFSTYDASTKKWRKVGVDNMGGQTVGTSDGMKDMKMEWAVDSMGPMGAMMEKEHIDMSDAKAGNKVSGEMSMDKGKTWKKTFEVVCKK